MPVKLLNTPPAFKELEILSAVKPATLTLVLEVDSLIDSNVLIEAANYRKALETRARTSQP